MVGFRNGMCHPFKPYDLNKDAKIDITEIPLHISDGTLFDYMKVDVKKAWYIIKKLIDITKNQSGVITLLWHNSHMKSDHLKLYKKILKYCNNLNGWITTAKNINDWCEKFYLNEKRKNHG